MSASFHVLNGIALILTDDAIRSRWHEQAAGHLTDLQREGVKWITDVWPNATIVPQAFINVSNRTDAYATRILHALDDGSASTAASLLDELGGDFAKGASTVAKYRGGLETVFWGALQPIGALTLGPASIIAVMAEDAKKVADLIAQIDAARKRIEDRAKKIADEMSLLAVKVAAFLVVIDQLKDGKPVKEWAKAFLLMMAAGTTPSLHKEEFLRDYEEILDKTNQIQRVGRDLFALINLGGVLKSVSEAAGGVSLKPVEALFTGASDRIRAISTRLRGGAETIAGARAAFAAEADHARRVAQFCQHFQEEAVEAQKPPTFILYQ
ncbi:MAG TPA: hypothetical protein VGQ76_25325 [Thermoanaerobaculia bacterium]|nr:hypothetical protein [Thermoanaerobaculia bacterium]